MCSLLKRFAGSNSCPVGHTCPTGQYIHIPLVSITILKKMLHIIEKSKFLHFSTSIYNYPCLPFYQHRSRRSHHEQSNSRKNCRYYSRTPSIAGGTKKCVRLFRYCIYPQKRNESKSDVESFPPDLFVQYYGICNESLALL
jgi:hypothetical protein